MRAVVLRDGKLAVRETADPQPGPGELPLVLGAGAVRLSTVAALKACGVGPVVVSDLSDDRLGYTERFGADVLVNPANRDPYEVWREVFRANIFQTPQVIFECVGAPHPQDWYGALDAVVDGRLDPSPSIGRTIGLDEVPEAIDQVRKGQGPPRVVVHPGAP